MPNKYLEGCTKVGGLYRLYEKNYVDSTSVEKITLSEKLTESINGKDFNVYGAYTVKIWDVANPNLNKRNYRRVCNQVIQENKVTYGFVNHPKDGEEDPARIYSVQKNPRIKEGWLVVDIILIGDYGKLAESALAVGGPLCVSSSALGDVDSNGDVIPGDEFILERYGDWVWGPSNGAYQYLKDVTDAEGSMQEEKVKAVKELITESVEKIKEEDNKKEIEKENLTIYNESIDQNKKGESSMPDKLIETNLTFNIRGLLKECDVSATLAEQKSLLETALEAAEQLSDKTLFEDIKKRLAENVSKTIDFAEKGKSVDSLNESIKSLKEEVASLTDAKAKLEEAVEKLNKEKEDLSSQHITLVKMYEDKQFEVSEVESKEKEKLAETLKKMLARNIFLKKKSAYLTEKRDYFEALSNSKVDPEYLLAVKKEAEEAEKKYLKIKEAVEKRVGKKIVEKKSEPKVEKKPEVAFANADVETYFNRILTKDASVVALKEQYSKCKSIKEAQLLRLKTKDKNEDIKKPTKITETKVAQKNTPPVRKSSLEITLERNGLF